MLELLRTRYIFSQDYVLAPDAPKVASHITEGKRLRRRAFAERLDNERFDARVARRLGELDSDQAPCQIAHMRFIHSRI